jgi:glyoxylase-like metal-dependent hydrolase (beta-lactamase superfamily II)
VRVLALHPDVLVVTSAIWQTNCVVVRAPTDAHRGEALGGTPDREGGHETFVVDSPVLPDELDALPTLLEQAGFAVPSGLLATHGDWDHLLGPLAFAGVALGCAQSTAERLRAAPGTAQRELRAFDEQYLIERPRPLALGAIQALPVPGRCGLGEQELELHSAEGHTEDGMALWVPWARVLLAGDYLSSAEIPTLGDPSAAPSHTGSPLQDYLATLERLRPLAEAAEHVVPGHGPVLDSAGALAILDEDLVYLHALAEHGVKAEIPPGRRTAFQRGLHIENAAHVAI